MIHVEDFSATKTRKFFNKTNKLKHLRNRDLKTLMIRAKTALKFRNLMKIERKKIRELKLKLQAVDIDYRKVLAKENQKENELKELKNLENKFKNQITKFKLEENSYKGQLKRYIHQREMLERKLIELKKKTI